MNSDTLAQTYVRHDDKWFYVSTINRDCSAVESPYRYAETLVWEYNLETKLAGKLIGQFEDGENRIAQHQEVVDGLYKRGTAEHKED